MKEFREHLIGLFYFLISNCFFLNSFFFSAENCDILIIVIDINQFSLNENLSEQINKHITDLFANQSSTFHSLTKLILLNKIDLIKSSTLSNINSDILPISCLSNANIQDFLSKLTQLISEK